MPSKIVVLDGYALNPGDLSWRPLEELAPTEVFDRTPAEEVPQRAAGANIVLTNKALLTGPTIAQLESLEYIGVLATGYNVVDMAAASERGVVVTNVPAYSTMSVVQSAFGHIIHLTLRTGDHAAAVAHGEWAASPDFAFWNHPLVEIAGKTLGIVGFGEIGQAVAKVARAFDMDVLISTRTAPTNLPPGVHAVSLDDLFRQSDFVSLHCPLTDDTKGMVDQQRLQSMKPTACLINTSRGPVLDEAAVAAALNEGRIAGAGLDVLSSEPPRADNPLLTAKNCFITPHIAWATVEARKRLLTTAIENVRAYLRGSPQNVVN